MHVLYECNIATISRGFIKIFASEGIGLGNWVCVFLNMCRVV